MIHVVGGIGVGAYGAHFVLNPVRNWIANNFPVLAPAVKLMETAAGFYMIVMGKSLFIKAAGAGMIASEAIVKATQHLIPGIAGYDQDYHMIKLPISGEVENMLAGLLHNSDRPVYTHQVSGLHVTPQVSGPTMTPQISSTEEVEELQTYPNARW